MGQVKHKIRENAVALEKMEKYKDWLMLQDNWSCTIMDVE